MKTEVTVQKDDSQQQLVPSIWRNTLAAIMEAFRCGDFEIRNGVPGVAPVSASLARQMFENVVDYGAKLASLPEESWETSVSQWMGKHWDVLIDLFDERNGPIDLVLHVRVRENNGSYLFEVLSLHVP